MTCLPDHKTCRYHSSAGLSGSLRVSSLKVARVRRGRNPDGTHTALCLYGECGRFPLQFLCGRAGAQPQLALGWGCGNSLSHELLQEWRCLENRPLCWSEWIWHFPPWWSINQTLTTLGSQRPSKGNSLHCGEQEGPEGFSGLGTSWGRASLWKS